MKKFNLGLLALLLSLVCFAATHAGTVAFEGDVGDLSDTDAVPGQTGVVNIVFDLDPQDSLQNGGVSLGVTASGAFIQITGAEVLNPGGRWTIASDATVGNNVQFNASSILSPAFSPAGSQNQIFATINYTVLGPGVTNLTFGVGPETLVDGRDFGTDVTNNYAFLPNFIDTNLGVIIPEPATMAMAGMALIGLAFRRRNG